MSARKASTRVLSMLLVLCMVVGMMPMGAFAAETDTLAASLEEAKTFIDSLTVNNSSNDPEKVVTTVGTHFSWDNEKRENSKKYLYEWSYYNGVVFEGLDYVYDVTGETAYYSYVKEYLDAMITDGELNSYAGYVNYHGADCYKTASLLLDYYKLTGDDKYRSVAEELYGHLTNVETQSVTSTGYASGTELLSDAGYNFGHTWASASSPALWLDGLYMILPFRAEYAAYSNDTAELDQIVERLTWVSNNMYDETAGVFYHAADNASSNSGTFWLRSIGWYAAALADVMDSMSGDNRTALQAQLKKLVDGMLPYQRESGVWSNGVVGTVNTGDNREETSGTALLCYAILKAVNNGWLDESYADVALNAFVGICENYLESNVLTNICFKGVPGNTSNFNYDNEGKGVGPFIMLYAEVLEYVENQEEEVPETTEAPTEAPTEAAKEIKYVTVNKGDGTPYVVGDTFIFELYIGYTDGSGTTVTQDDCTYVIHDANTTAEVALDVAMSTPGSYYAVVTYAGNTLDKYVTFTVSAGGESGYETLSLAINGAVLNSDIKDVTESVSEAMKTLENLSNYVAYDIDATINEGETATVSIPVPADWTVGTLKVYHITAEGAVDTEDVQGEYNAEEGVYTFIAKHFSVYALTNTATPTADDGNTVSGTGALVGGKTYTLNTDGEIDTTKTYLIVNTDNNTTNGHALTNNSGTVGDTTVTVSGGKITVADDSKIAWTFSGRTSGSVGNNGRYVYPNNGSLSLNTSGSNLSISDQGDGEYQIYRYSDRYYSVYYNSGWSGYRSRTTIQSVYLYEYTSSSAGEAVTFTVTPASDTILPKGTTTLTGTVQVGDTTYDLSDLDAGDITWSTNASAYATVSGGVVTGVADGKATITATLNSVKGVALEKAIELDVAITVQSKKISTKVLSGNSQINVTLNETPDYSNIKYTVTYVDGTYDVYTAENGLTFGACDTSTSGKKVVDIMYNGTKIGEVVVNVTVDFSLLDPATDYPQYPNDGAVRIDKTATHNAEEFNRTGVTHVELDVAGISVESAVDVILIMDISNSMSWDDSEYDYNDTTITSGSNQRLNIARDSAKEFVNELMKDNGDDDPETVDNTITMLAFAGIDGDYNDHSTAKANDDVYQVGELAMDTITEANAALDTLVKATTGGTNYDYAFQQAYELAEQLHNERGNRVYIVFMTDGVPTHYNGVYYKSRNNTDLTALMNYVDPATGEESRYTSTGYDRAGNDIDATATMPITVYYNNGTTANKTVTYNKGWSDYVVNNKNGWAEKVKALDYVAHVYAIGFGMKNGSVTQGATSSMPTLNYNGGQYYIPSSTTHAVLQHIASDANSHFEADNKAELTKLYQTLATQIKFAGTEARVTDTVGNNFSVQMAPYVVDKDGNQIKLATAPTITIKTYDLYARGSTDEEGNDITGERTGVSNDIEIVTFNDDGTEAYSSVIGAGVNIMSTDANGTTTINAKYFTYTKTSDSVETFVWNIGNITDKEIALTFDAYLEGSMSGERPENVYYTNEKGIVEYVDINGDYAKQIFPRPGVAWGGATTTIRFYLVDHEGYPVNRDGDRVPWANRVYVGEPVIVTLNLNGEMEIEAQKIEAAAHVPSGFFLYDNNAYYIVETTSSTEAVVGGITVSDPSDDANKTTGTAPNEVTQTGAQTTRVISFEDPYYTWSIVGFGVRYDLTAEKTEYVLVSDQVVVDYGKAIQVDVLANDPVREGYTREVVGFAKYSAGTDLTYIQQNAGSATYTAELGGFSIVGDKVQFQPTKMMDAVQKVFYVAKYTPTGEGQEQNFYYVWGQLDVIPATIMYYETDFANVFKTTGTWTADKTVSDDSAADGPQDYVAIDADDLYGADSTYNNDKYLSNGSSYFVEGQGVNATYVEFAFTGTGFDLISRTGTEQGAIRVDVYSDEARTTRIKSVTVLNKSESAWELYQIPVASIEMNEHGTYYVTVRVSQAYENEKFPDLNRGAEFYFDAIRVYNPIVASASAAAGSDAAIAYAAYENDGELNPQIIEVRNILLDAEEFDGAGVDGNYEFEKAIVFGEVVVDSPTVEGGTVQRDVVVSTYQTIGPNNEVYLSNGQGISFNVETGATAPKTFNIGAKSVNGGTVVLEATIFKNGTQVNKVTTTNITSSTIQFITLLEMSKVESNAVYQVVITNRGTGVLSVTDLKFAGSSAADDVQLYSDTISVDMMKHVLVYGAPKVEEEVETPDFGVVSAEFTADNAKRGETVNMVINTSADVAEVAVLNANGSKLNIEVISVTEVDGQKVWTVSFKLTSAGTQTFTAVGYNTAGETGTTADATIKVNIR